MPINTNTPLNYVGQYIPRTYEIDQHKHIPIHVLVQWMNEAAMQNVIEIGVSLWDLEPHKLSWVLMRLDINIQKMPKFGSMVYIDTYPAGFETIYTYRDYHIFENETLIATASSRWLLMHTQKRSLCKIPPFILTYESEMWEKTQYPISKPHRKLTIESSPIVHHKHYQVSYYDLDFNAHLNNALYLKWLVESMPNSFLAHHQISNIQILYLLEARLHDKIVATSYKIDKYKWTHVLTIKAESDVIILRAKTTWRLF